MNRRFDRGLELLLQTSLRRANQRGFPSVGKFQIGNVNGVGVREAHK